MTQKVTQIEALGQKAGALTHNAEALTQNAEALTRNAGALTQKAEGGAGATHSSWC